MKLIKLTALPLLALAWLCTLNSCEMDAEMKKTTDFQKLAIPTTGANVYPTSNSPAIGKLDVFYTKETRLLTYTITFSGLTDSVSAIHIHGLAPLGYSTATIVQNVVAASNGVFAQKTSGKFTYAKSGILTGTLLVDGSVVKEADLLNGMYYIDIHSNNSAGYPNGEIRAQIVFQ
jgi:hypothetical protein